MTTGSLLGVGPASWAGELGDERPAVGLVAGRVAGAARVAQTFLQLVLLSVIMVGQNVQAAAADKRAEATFHDASATLHEVAHVQGHLAAQDVLLSRIAQKIGLDPVPVIDAPPDELTWTGDDDTGPDDETAGPDPDS
jgi:hypothetical protein